MNVLKNNDMFVAVATSPHWRVASAVAALLVAIYLSYFALVRPALDWDVVPYTMAILKGGAFIKDGVVDAPALHAATWAALEPYLTPELKAYMASDSYRRRQLSDPAALVSQLVLFESKYGYVLALKALSTVLSPVYSIVLLSLLASLGLLALLVAMAWPLRGVATLAWLPFVLLFKLPGFASTTTPDITCAFLAAAGFSLLLRERKAAGVALLVAAAFVRPDSLILNLFFAAALALRRDFLAAIVLAALSFAAYRFNVGMSGHIGWWAQFHYNFIEIQETMVGYKPVFDLGQYLEVLAIHFKEILHLPWLHAAVASALLAAVLLATPGTPWPSVLFLAVLGGTAARFLLYPSADLRLYVPQVFMLSVLVLHIAATRFRPGRG